MNVVADTSPICHLVRIQQSHVLSELFGQIVVPSQVVNELSHLHAPLDVRSFIANPPAWLSVQTLNHITPIPVLDPGEEAAINLAFEIKADFLFMDEKTGRRIAANPPWNLNVLGTLGILEMAANNGLLSLRSALKKLLDSHFYVNPTIIQNMLEKHKNNIHHQ